MNDLRTERERVGRRWALAGNVFMAILVVTGTSYAVTSAAMRTCGRHLFGFGDGYRWCGLAETWSWLRSDDAWSYWIFMGVIVVACAVQLLRNRD